MRSMAYPSDPRNPPEARGRLTPEEADRLAAMFRPSWEMYDAQAGPVQPGQGASPSTPSGDLRPAQGDGARPDARAPAPAPVTALNGSHATALSAPAVPQQPESSVIVDSSDILPSSRAGAPVPTAHTLVLSDPVGGVALRGGPSAIPARTVPFSPAPPAPRVATPLEMAEFVEPDFVKPAKRMGLGLWAGIGVAAAAVIGIGVWLGSSSEEKHPAATPLPERVHVAPPPVPPPPPPPAETVASQPPAPVVPAVPPPSPPPATPSPPVVTAPQPAIAAAAPAPISNTTQPAAAAVAAPQKLFVPPAPQRPTWVPPPRPAVAPAPRPKPASPTIVRDAPF